MKRLFIKVSGIVQGVGFRPFVFNIAERLELKGTVKNTSQGVEIDIEGNRVDEFVELLKKDCPPLSLIDNVETYPLEYQGYKDFRIIQSDLNEGFTLISPDVSICNDCLKELLDRNNRRFHYPFVNCTNCGPRYSITLKVPYDRPNTTMAKFEMCPDCLHEYHDPRDRRFHAQPNACKECGPNLSFRLFNTAFVIDEKDSPLKKALTVIKSGGIIAIKGIGGFHLCCDATNEKAVTLLRQRKRKSNKPFAIMVPDKDVLYEITCVDDFEIDLVSNNRRPIVLLKKRQSPNLLIASSVSPKNRYLGCMLPYTPLHYLLFFSEGIKPSFKALVMTSGNRADEPIVKDDEEAIKKLSAFVDGILGHNRDIFTAIDDTVLRVDTLNGKVNTFFIRRARGYVPEVIDLKEQGLEVLGVGADIKNAFTITKDRFAIMSQHIGDMENEETLNFFEQTLNNLNQVYGVRPIAVGYDMHPNYLSTRWAEGYIKQNGIKGYAIQHHHSHICSVMAENNLTDKVIGIAFDGAGYGIDGNIWGSEFLICQEAQFKRIGHFDYIPLAGGDMASRQCWRSALGLIKKNTSDSEYWIYIDKIGVRDFFSHKEISSLTTMIDHNVMTPLSCGVGRYFDAIAAITNTCFVNTFEGESAMALENLTEGQDIDTFYPFTVSERAGLLVVNLGEAIHEVLFDVLSGVSSNVISCKFHNTIVEIIKDMIHKIATLYNTNQIALSGGVFQNSYLLKKVTKALIIMGMKVYFNTKVPCNDGGISLGQVYILRKALGD